MTIQLVDTDDPRGIAAHVAQFKAQGGTMAMIYINPIWLAGDKTGKKPTIDALHAAGIDVGFNCEGWGGSSGFAHNDISAATGGRDGQVCKDWLEQLGAPQGICVYASIDNDTSPSQIANLCIPYFKAFKIALAGKYRLGAYGCGALLSALDAQSLIDKRWLSNAMGWSGSLAYKASMKWDILQGLPTRAIGGVDVDPDQLNPNTADFGFWNPSPSIMDINSDVAGA